MCLVLRMFLHPTFFSDILIGKQNQIIKIFFFFLQCSETPIIYFNRQQQANQINV